MKGLMVSLIIVIFAGVSSTPAAGQQAGEGAAGFRPRLGLQPLGALERPGPDDSEDEIAWPAPISSLSRDSTNTSNSSGDRQSSSQSFGGGEFNSPAPASAVDQGIRFDVKISDAAIDQLRQGRKVSADVDVRDRSNTLLPPEVVSDIAFFRDANANENIKMNGIHLEPAPLAPNSQTLRFEIAENQLDRIEQDAFVFSVPENLRGRFNRVEFVKASGPTGSHDFSSNVSGGTRGTGFGLAGSSDTNRLNSGSPNRSESTSNPSEFARRWNTESPLPGPSDDGQFSGPQISQRELEARRNRMSRLDSDPRLGQQNGVQRQDDRSILNTGSQFQFSENKADLPNRNLFDRPRESEGTPSTIKRWNGLEPRNAVNQRTGPTAADLRLAEMQQQLDLERAEKERLARDASQWRGEANRIAQQRDSYSERLREASSRSVVQQASANRSSNRSNDFQRTNPAYLDRALDVAGDVVRPRGTPQENFQTHDAAFERKTMTDNEIYLQRENARLAESLKLQAIENGRLEGQLTRRIGPGQSEIQKTSYGGAESPRDRYVSTADRRNILGSDFQNPQNIIEQRRHHEKVEREGHPEHLGSEPHVELPQEDAPVKSRASDLIWLLPLLLGSLGLNFFLWIHCRTLDLRYNDLADELRDMVGTSTAV